MSNHTFHPISTEPDPTGITLTISPYSSGGCDITMFKVSLHDHRGNWIGSTFGSHEGAGNSPQAMAHALQVAQDYLATYAHSGQYGVNG